MIWHVYPGDTLPVLVGARALCGHVAEVETDRLIGPDDERCAVCVKLLGEQSDIPVGARVAICDGVPHAGRAGRVIEPWPKEYYGRFPVRVTFDDDDTGSVFAFAADELRRLWVEA